MNKQLLLLFFPLYLAAQEEIMVPDPSEYQVLQLSEELITLAQQKTNTYIENPLCRFIYENSQDDNNLEEKKYKLAQLIEQHKDKLNAPNRFFTINNLIFPSNTPLECACDKGAFPFIEVLIHNGANPNLFLTDPTTSKAHTFSLLYTACLKAFTSKKPEDCIAGFKCVASLLACGANPDIGSFSNEGTRHTSPLANAALYSVLPNPPQHVSPEKLALLLVSHRADLNRAQKEFEIMCSKATNKEELIEEGTTFLKQIRKKKDD